MGGWLIERRQDNGVVKVMSVWIGLEQHSSLTNTNTDDGLHLFVCLHVTRKAGTTFTATFEGVSERACNVCCRRRRRRRLVKLVFISFLPYFLYFFPVGLSGCLVGSRLVGKKSMGMCRQQPGPAAGARRNERRDTDRSKLKMCDVRTRTKLKRAAFL